MTPDQQDFYVEEFKALRKEIEQRISESGTTFSNAVIWIGVIYAWLFRDGVASFQTSSSSLWAYRYALFVPIWISLWIFFRILENQHQIRSLGEYIQTIENRLKVEGWEHRPVERVWGLSIFILWALLPIATLAIATVVLAGH